MADPSRHAPRVVVAHDWLVTARGGEAVLERLCAIVRRDMDLAGLYAMTDLGRPLGPEVEAARAAGLVRTSWLQRVPGAAGRLRRWALPCYPAAVAHLSRRLRREHERRPIDLVISSSSSAIKSLRAPPGVPHICYCHAPARYLWSRREDYAGGARELGLRLAGPRLRAWDRRTADRVDLYVANSSHTAGEIRRCYGRDSVVVHPPVRTGLFTPPADGGAREDFWLVVSALEPYKRVDLAIDAARRAGHRLVVAGTGSEWSRLRARAGAGVEMIGHADVETLRRLYRTARVLLFPQVEDFGIVAAEALASGLPVVARAAGGALDIVEDGRTGALFHDPTPAALLDAIARAPSSADAACRESALRFSEESFDRRFGALIERVLLAGRGARGEGEAPAQGGGSGSAARVTAI